jgi:MraZ protein
VFQGSSQLSLDAKGRMAVPSRYRALFDEACAARLTLTRHPHGCLLLFPRPIWEAHREKISAWPMSARSWQRIFLGNALDVEVDASGRVLIAPELRHAAKLGREVMLLGMGSHFELWDAASLGEDEAKAIKAGIPDVLSNYSF